MMKLLLIIIVTLLFIKNNAIAACELPITNRIYYIAAEDVEWNYLPQKTPVYFQLRKHASKYENIADNEPRIGNVYKKSVFREYTDNTFKIRKAQKPEMAILGPLLKAEVCDTVEITLYNKASHGVTLHTHGGYYDKFNDGAFSYNKTNEGSLVRSGDKFVYHWTIREELGPTESDSNCQILAYHSHVNADLDIMMGLVGPLIICKKGTLNEFMSSKSYILLFLIFDENVSWYLEENIKKHIGNLSESEIESLKEDENFQVSNQKYTVNGLMYDNLSGLDICLGTTIAWHLIGFGNEHDFHAVEFAGHPISFNGHRTDRMHVTPAVFLTSLMTTQKEGRFSIKSTVGNNYLEGMQTHFTVVNCGKQLTTESDNGRERTYYIAAEEVMWDYAPTDINIITNKRLTDDSITSKFFRKDTNRIGGKYKKVLYREYTDDTFSTRKIAKLHMEFLGPTLRAEVGDTLKVVFFNKAHFPFNIYSIAFTCENCSIEDRKAVLPGELKVYIFKINEIYSPSETDPQCVNWRYYSNVHSEQDSFSGLNGILMTCRKGSLNNDGSQKYISDEFSLMFAIIDENKSLYIDDNIELFLNQSEHINKEEEDFIASNKMNSINGLMYGNLIGLNFCSHDNLSFNLISLSDEEQFDVVSFQENVFNHNGNYKSTIELIPGDHAVVTMKPDDIGKFFLHSHVNDHLHNGMATFYYVLNCNNESTARPTVESGKLREYFIAIDEEEWNFSTTTIHYITGEMLTENEESKIFVTKDDTHIGTKYKKALFREYTNSSFTKRKQHEEHLGMLGPMIKAEIGDTIKITFYNNASRDYNIQPQGIFINSDGTVPPVKPGETTIYNWFISEKSGPSENGFNCINSMYYSTVDIVKDTNSGLVGPIVICRTGILQESGLRKDVNKEFATLFSVIDENESHYLEENIITYCRNSSVVDKENETFIESNLKHAINGRIYASLKGLEGKLNDKVAWYLMALGNEVDIHTAHSHGLALIVKNDDTMPHGHREDVVELLPGICETGEMLLDNVGHWMYHCHVDDHLTAGMIAMITVNP